MFWIISNNMLEKKKAHEWPYLSGHPYEKLLALNNWSVCNFAFTGLLTALMYFLWISGSTYICLYARTQRRLILTYLNTAFLCFMN